MSGRVAREGRCDEAIGVVRRGLVQAEEKYLVDPDATLGTWFARVQDTVAVACRVTVARVREGRAPTGAAHAAEQLGLYAYICAEAIRAAAQVWGEEPSPRVRESVLVLLVGGCRREATLTSWPALLLSLACCGAALEPLAIGLREKDLPMGESTDREQVLRCLLEAAQIAFGVVDALA